MSQRIVKLNKLIRQHLDEILTRNLSVKPGVFLTLSKVDTTADLRYTRVSISVFPEKEAAYAMKTLKKEAYDIQGELNRRLQMKQLPRLQFINDETESKADVIEKILKEI
jgi:ribosome-binding factor A